MADLRARLARWLRTDGLDMAETLGTVTIAVAVVTYLVSMSWFWMVVLTVCVGIRLHRRAGQTAELARYRRGDR